MKKKFESVDKYRDLILETNDYIWKHPETGFREWGTSKYMEEAFEKLGYDLVKAGDIPGFYTILDTGRPGPEVLVLGELDSLINPDHPNADPVTGACHTCGHNAQCAALLGLAAALKEPGMLDGLSGRIRLCAVPAEELLELDFRMELIEKGILHCLVGKGEFLYRGYFDGVDLAFMVHTGGDFSVVKGRNGCVTKRAIYKGVSAHAGGSPWQGKNALYAATQGLAAINSIRETFKESDMIRVHPIIKQGGGAVNAIPDHVEIECLVRCSNYKAMAAANEKVNRALCGAALSLGVNVDIQDMPGFAPMIENDGLKLLMKDAAAFVTDQPFVIQDKWLSSSSDMGNLSLIMPTLMPKVPGAKGVAHGNTFMIEDPETACVTSAKWQLAALILLLQDDAIRAKKIIDDFIPEFASKEEYFKYMDALACSGDRIVYNGDGTATITM